MKSIQAAAVFALALGAAAPLRAADEPIEATHPVEHLLQFRGNVLVGEDGNGVLSGQFPTTVEGEAVRYVLVIESCAAPPPAPCPPEVQQLRVTLNGTIVFDDGTGPFDARVPVALNAVGGANNQIVATAHGTPGSAARVTVAAIRPLPVVVGGRSVLPLATSGNDTVDLLVAHNAGPANAVFRLEFFNTDGTSAGLTAPRELAAHASLTIDLGATGGSLVPAWTRGAVHVRWAARGWARMSTVAREFRRAADGAGRPLLILGSELALDDYRPVPLGPSEAALFGF